MQTFGNAELWAAPQSYLDIFYALRKTRSPEALQSALAASLERINLRSTDHADMLVAYTAGWNGIKDALIGIAAKKVSADYLLTRDEEQQSFRQLGIPTLSPEAFFEFLHREHGVTFDAIGL